jgi:glycosyltransferase involved in cell wall biosynthesis
MNGPLVSILINNYNYGRFLSEAIDSALGQTYGNTEVIVVDDGSTDNSREIISGYGTRIIPVLKENGGQASAFNIGVKISRGDILCFLDSDDMFGADKAERIVRMFEDNKDAGWVYHDLAYIDAQGTPLKYGERAHDYSLISGVLLDFTAAIRKGNPIEYGPPATTALSLRRDLLQKYFPLSETLKITENDDCLKVPALCLAKGIHLAEDLGKQRIHGRNSYTARKDNLVQRLEINICTATFLRERVKEAAPFADKLFARNFGALAGKMGLYYVAHNSEASLYLKRYGKKFSMFNICRLIKAYSKSKYSLRP